MLRSGGLFEPFSCITVVQHHNASYRTAPIKYKMGSAIFEGVYQHLAHPTLTNLYLVSDIGVLVNVEDFEDIIPIRNLKNLRFADSWSMSTILPYPRAPLLEMLIIRNWYPEGFSTRDYNYSFSSTLSLSSNRITNIQI